MDVFSIRPTAREVGIAIPGTGEVMHVELRPPTDPVVRAAQRRFRDRSAREAKTWTDEQERAALAEFGAAWVSGWRMPDGWVQHECTPETVRALLMQADWLLREILEAAQQHEAFFRPTG